MDGIRTPEPEPREGGEGPPPDPEEEAPPTQARGPAPDRTLGGYLRHHGRPPAFEGSDGQAYTVSAEVERTGDLLAPCAGFLVFPRWAEGGMGIVDHLETPTLVRGRTAGEVRSALEALTLVD